MAVELATGYISLVPSTRGLGRGIARELTPALEAEGRRAGDAAGESFGGRFSAGITRAAKTAGIALGAAFAAAGTYGVKVAADFQQTRIAFEGILGSADEANKRLTELQDFAAGTPFEFTGLAESAQNLLAVGFAADDIIPTMTTLGNVAATLGVGEAEIKGVVRALGQMKGKGKASAEELQQISEQVPGFSAIQAIADDMGISVAEAFDKVAKGAVPADKAISAILAGMEAFPGAAGAMERQSQTLNGVISTFKDTLNIALIEGIEPFLPAIAGALQGAIPFVETFISRTIGGISTVVTGFGDMAGAVRGFIDEVSGGNVAGGIAVEIGKLVGLAEDHPLVTALADALKAVGAGGQAAFEGLKAAAGFVSAEFTALITGAKDAWSDYATLGVGPVAEALTDTEDSLAEVNRLFQEHYEIIVPLTGAVAGLATAFAGLRAASALSGVVGIIAAIGPAIAGLLAPILAPVALVVAAVAAIAGAFALAYFHIQPFRDAVDGIIDTVGEFISGFIDDAIPAIQGFGETIADVAGAIASGFTRGVSALGGVIQRNIITPLRPLGRFLSDEVLPAFEAFGGFVSALFDRIGDVVGPAITILQAQFGFLAGVVADFASGALRILGTQLSVVFDIFQTVAGVIADVLAPGLGLAFDALAAVIDIAWGVIVGIIQTSFDIITGIFTALTGILTGDFGQVWAGITQALGAPVEAGREIVVNTFEEIIAFVGGVPGRVGDFITAIFGGGIAIAEAVFGGILDIVTTTFEEIITFVSGLPGRIDALTSGMWDGIAEAFEGVINFIIQAWNSLDFEIPGFDPPGPGPKFSGFTLGLPQIDPVNFATGGIVTARPGGLIGRLGEAGRDELVTPLPNGFDITDLTGRNAPLVGGDLVVQQLPGEDAGDAATRALRKQRMMAGI
jgi:tape measure domain-containing protein